MTDIEIPVGKRTPKYRFFEMMPLVLSVSILLTPLVLSFIQPVWAAAFIIVYIISWVVRAVGMAIRTIQGYNAMSRAQQVKWRSRLKDLENPSKALNRKARKTWGYAQHIRNLKRIAENPESYPKPTEVYNAVIVATYNESRDVLEPTIQSVLENEYDHENHTILVIAYEERGGQATKDLVRELISEYGDKFYHAVAIEHPDGLPNEVVGKGGNITWAGRKLREWLGKKKINPDNVIVTTLDSDNRPHRSYLSYVTYEYIINPDRRYVAFQPIALFLNNIWDVPAPMRVLATGNSFWTIINSLRPHMLRNFASHSQGMQSLIDTDFWSTRTIVEDGHQFWRSYFRFDGRYDVVPIFVPIYQDAVLAETTRKTLKAQFVQLRRWAYGASDIAYVATKGFRKGRSVPFFDLLAKFVRLVDGHVSWASASIIIALGAWTPLFLHPEASRSIAAHQLPELIGQLMRIAMIGLLITIFLAFKMLPPRPERYKRRRNVWMLLQWVMMPLVSIGYGSAAALTAQTRLFTARYLDKFDVTVKAVVKEDKSRSV
jgi:cellulose synthase/poly-beta-1,6-N-acetylglucosamine synthase-like glycosyltransferase